MIEVDKILLEDGSYGPDIPEGLEYKSVIYQPETDNYLVEFTPEQLRQIEMPKLDFKLALLEKHNITDDQIKAGLEQIPDFKTRERLKLQWFESRVIKKNDPNLLAMAPQFGLTEQNINDIFENR